MGPLASAEFLRTIYRLNAVEPEQAAPRCLMHSDPSIPDRTQSIRENRSGELVERLVPILDLLLDAGADSLVIACVTIHHVVPDLPARIRNRLVSLIDQLVAAAAATPGRLLLLATSGTRAARVIERHPGWPAVAPRVIYPSEPEQARLHGELYRLKRGGSVQPCRDWLDGLAAAHRAEGLIFGCTELHLLAEALRLRPAPWRAVDPLAAIARRLGADGRSVGADADPSLVADEP